MAKQAHLALALLVSLGAAAPLAHAAATTPGATRGFEGRIQLRLMDAMPQGATYSVSGERARIDVPAHRGAPTAYAIVDFARRTLTTASRSSRQTASLPLPALGAAAEGVSVQKTGKTRAVVGQACEEWKLLDAGHTVEACVVPGVAWFDPRRLSGQQVPAWSRRLEAERAFPVSVWEGDAGGHTVFASWATDVKRETVGDQEFAVPRTARRPR